MPAHRIHQEVHSAGTNIQSRGAKAETQYAGARPGIPHEFLFTRLLAMDASLLTSLTVPQLFSLIFVLVCELTQRLGTPIEVAATIGDAIDDNNPDAATSVAGPASTAAPTTPSAPLPATQCHFICSVANCDNLCAAAGVHGSWHRCEQHWWD